MDALVLIVEDDRDLCTTLQYILEREGYRTLVAPTGNEARERLQQTPVPGLVLLDVMLPDLSGTEICRELRSRPATAEVPVIMLSARNEEIDRVVGFEVGADDYVGKPFSVRELLLRIRALLRRKGQIAAAPEQLSYADLQMDLRAHHCTLHGSRLALTPLEFRLLRTLVERQGRAQTRETLLRDVWGLQPGVTTRTVDTHVKRLRHKLGALGSHIETVRGIGYRLGPRAVPREG